MLVGLPPGNPRRRSEGAWASPSAEAIGKPRESTFPQVSIVTGDTDDSAFPAKNFTIFEGTSEIQRMVIGRTDTGLDVR